METKRILVVEDELELRNLYVSILKDAGYQTNELAQGVGAAQKIKAGNYDLVLLDIMMPKENGIEVLEELQNDPATKDRDFHIVILTNLGQDAIIAKGVSLKIRGFMIKSDYTPDQFLKEVREYLA